MEVYSSCIAAILRTTLFSQSLSFSANGHVNLFICINMEIFFIMSAVCLPTFQILAHDIRTSARGYTLSDDAGHPYQYGHNCDEAGCPPMTDRLPKLQVPKQVANTVVVSITATGLGHSESKRSKFSGRRRRSSASVVSDDFRNEGISRPELATDSKGIIRTKEIAVEYEERTWCDEGHRFEMLQRPRGLL